MMTVLTRVRFSDDLSTICRHKYFIVQFQISKLQSGEFINLLYCPYHRMAQRSTVCDSPIYSSHAAII